jgi:hypothetical protein
MMLGDSQQIKIEDAGDAARCALYDALYARQLSAN